MALRRPITDHDKVLDAITRSRIFSELVQKTGDHFEHEKDLEVIVYGRHYGGKQVGPYVQLFEYDPGDEIIQEDWPAANNFYVLVEGTLDVLLREPSYVGRTEIVPDDPIFGAMALLPGQPTHTTMTVSAGAKAKVLEIGRPALRLLRKYQEFSTRLDSNYRSHGLNRTLREVKALTKTEVTPALLAELDRAAQFKVYAKGHLLFKQGDPIESVILVRRGWIQRARHLDSDLPLERRLASNPKLAATLKGLKQDVGLDFLGASNWLGLEAVTSEGRNTWEYTATVMARTEVLEIEIADPLANRHLVEMIKAEFPQYSNADDDPPERPTNITSVEAAAIEIDEGIIDGANLLVMDMDLCIRCGNCSLACHRVHGQSRLMRHGINIARPVKLPTRSIQHVLAPSVCLHCHDAECLTGCPTGAIGRFSTGQIDIEAKDCIGCGDCATQCPYDAISMIPRNPKVVAPVGLLRKLGAWLSLSSQEKPPDVIDTGKPDSPTKDLVAVKCNLCQGTPLNPKGKEKKPAYSCQENCPTGALVRVDPQEYFSEAKNAIGIRFRDDTHAVGRNIHHRDIPAMVIHICGVFAIIAITAAVLWAARRYTLDRHLFGTWLTLRWATGIAGLVTLVGVGSYPFRKQVYRRRAGPLRYWMWAHVYLGLIAGPSVFAARRSRIRQPADFRPEGLVRSDNCRRPLRHHLLPDCAAHADSHRGRAPARRRPAGSARGIKNDAQVDRPPRRPGQRENAQTLLLVSLPAKTIF